MFVVALFLLCVCVQCFSYSKTFLEMSCYSNCFFFYFQVMTHYPTKAQIILIVMSRINLRFTVGKCRKTVNSIQ